MTAAETYSQRTGRVLHDDERDMLNDCAAHGSLMPIWMEAEYRLGRMLQASERDAIMTAAANCLCFEENR
jgi:hypothetical protein